VPDTPIWYETGASAIADRTPPVANCGTIRYFAPGARLRNVPDEHASVTA
jgi:hypothetical protein